jgi:hypothetical protein
MLFGPSLAGSLVQTPLLPVGYGRDYVDGVGLELHRVGFAPLQWTEVRMNQRHRSFDWSKSSRHK